MLTHLTINDFMLIDHLDLQLKSGMTAITGETGTGKSVLLGALGMALGERGDADRVRQGATKADVTATFLLDDLPQARQWLMDHDLYYADECLLRRVVTVEGRSRAFINSQPVTLQQTRALAELLIDIHSQHAHQSLLSKTSHRRLLDDFGRHALLVNKVSAAYRHWQDTQQRYLRLRDSADDVNSRYQLLSYQLDELDRLDLARGELDALEIEQQQLANAETMIEKTQRVYEFCDAEQGVSALLQQAIAEIQSMRPQTLELADIDELLSSAAINVDEARQSLRGQLESIEIDPERLRAVESRLSAIYDIARKHRIAPGIIPETHQRLAGELTTLANSDESLAVLESQAQEAKQGFYKLAQKLSQQRQQSAQDLSKVINQQLQHLAMDRADVLLAVNPIPNKPNDQGIDDVEILISTNPGQSHKPLNKIVSGGELSRISLAIQVATAQTSNCATLVFDEVDVGIGGKTAEVVGNLLASLGNQCQVLCVTHLAQVASKAHHHWRVTKADSEQNTETQIIELNQQRKIEEIARMLSGRELSEESLAHARLILRQAAG